MGKRLSEGLSGFEHLVERQMLLHERRARSAPHREIEAPALPYRFITISRDAGALGDAVASEVAMRLGWKVYDKEIVDYIAGQNNVLRDLVEQLDEQTQTNMQDSVERILSIFQRKGFGNDEYHVALIRALAALAAQGDCILLGHGATYALQEENGLHVRITASFPVRVSRLSKRWGLPLKETRRIVERKDQSRKSFVHHHFLIDREDLRYFHLVFNTDHFAAGLVVAAIISVIEKGREQAGIHPAIIEQLAFRSSEQVPG